MSNNQRVMDSLDDWLLMRWFKYGWKINGMLFLQLLKYVQFSGCLRVNFGWSYVTTGWLYVNIGCLIKSISSGFLELRCFSQECYRLLKAVPIAKPAGCLEIASCGTYLDLEMALFSAPTLFGRICAHSGFLWSLDWKMCICALMDGHRRFFPGIYARKCAPWIFAWKRTKWKNVNSGAISLLWGKNRSSSIFSSNENWSALFRLCTYG